MNEALEWLDIVQSLMANECYIKAAKYFRRRKAKRNLEIVLDRFLFCV